MTEKIAAVDYESYYDDECSIKVLGTDGCILHPKFEVYLVSIVTDGFEFVGHPDDAPWDQISGEEWAWIAHNASWDERVHYYLQKWSKVPAFARPKRWYCTADLCAFSAAPRALAAAANYLYQVKVSKDYRNVMKGKRFEEIDPKKQEQVKLAGIIDAKTARRFWKDLSPAWPESERRISQLSREQGWHGVRLDKYELESDAKHLKTIIWAAEQLIPWADKAAKLSYEALCAECKNAGIEAPPSTAMTSDECAAWEDKYGATYKWIDAMRTSRRATALLRKVETMLIRIRKEDGRMPYQNKYFGAHTGRWGDGGENQGRNRDSGFNSRNLPQKEMFGEEWFLGKLTKDGTREEPEGKNFTWLWATGALNRAAGAPAGVDLRKRIIPEEGHHFPIADLSQIEPRVSWQVAGDTASLDLVRQGMSPYEAHGRTTMGYAADVPMKKGDPPQYRFAKARVLALGYQAGWLKFITMARLYITDEDFERIFHAPLTSQLRDAFEDYLGKVGIQDWIDLWNAADGPMKAVYANSWKTVMEFRRANPLLAGSGRKGKPKGMWRKFQDALEDAIGGDFIVNLPSGRKLTYRKIERDVQKEITGIVMKGGRPQRIKLYGGLLFENYVQAVARDIFVECRLRLDDAGHRVVMDIHDEVVPEVPLSVSKEEIERIVSQSPSFWPDLPVASECESHLCYTK